VLGRLWRLFSPRQRAFIAGLFVLAAAGAIFEAFSIGLLVPVMALVQQPGLIHKNAVLQAAYTWSGSLSDGAFLSMLCVALLALFIFKNAYLAALLWVQNRFIYARYRQKAAELFRFYLQSPYTFHLGRNTAHLLRNVQSVLSVMNGVFLPMLQMLTEALVVVALLGLLIWNDPATSLVAAGCLGAAVGATYILIRRRLRKLGEIGQGENALLIQAVNQSLGSVKETKVLGREQFFERSFEEHLAPFSHANRQHSFLVQLPRYVSELAAVGLVLGLLWFALRAGQAPERVFVTLGLFAVAAGRLMPSMTRISSSLAVIRFHSAYLDEIYPDLIAAAKLPPRPDPRLLEGQNDAIPFTGEISLRDLTFRYEGSNQPAVFDLSLTIRSLESVAFVGPSGAGKTTAVDLLLGLYPPESGSILVDGRDIQEDIRAWQNTIGYVPQQIYLCDSSIRENIAFGIDPREIDEAAVRRALEMSQLDDFVASHPGGLGTFVGERGIRLSGGQRQRIGIARALYHDPGVLVMDEATAALDNETENAFMRSLEVLSGKKTMILIAHRLTTVEHCDRLFFLKDGRLVAQGTFPELLETNEDFRAFARPG